MKRLHSIFLAPLLACQSPEPTPVAPTNPTAQPESTTVVPTTSSTSASEPKEPARRELEGGLVIEDIQRGQGAEATKGHKIKVHYVGTLDDGSKFDSSRDRGRPFIFELGAGHVIKGWEQGIPGMRVGGIRKLTIPPTLGYGDRAMAKIPANSTLTFEVELLGVEP